MFLQGTGLARTLWTHNEDESVIKALRVSDCFAYFLTEALRHAPSSSVFIAFGPPCSSHRSNSFFPETPMTPNLLARNFSFLR